MFGYFFGEQKVTITKDPDSADLSSPLSSDVVLCDNSKFPLFPTLLNASKQDVGGQIFDPVSQKFFVRGKNYLKDRIKIEKENSLYSLIGADLVFTDKEDVINRASTTDCLSFAKARKNKFNQFVFIMNYQLPFGNIVFYWTPRKTEKNKEEISKGSYKVGVETFDKLIDALINGNKDERNSLLKIIPCLKEGGWLLSKFINGKPAIICQKIDCEWHCDTSQDQNYLEVVVNVSSSVMANKILDITKTCIESIVIDLAFTLEGKKEETLPEELFCAVRLNGIQLDKGVKLKHLKLIEEKRNKNHELSCFSEHEENSQSKELKRANSASLIN